MHEYPLTEEIIRIAEETALQNNATSIVSISLVIGELSGFIGDSISMYFTILAQGKKSEHAKLYIRYIKPKLQCSRCKEYFERERFSFSCPLCGAEGNPTEIGKEFYIENIEVEQL